MKRYSNATVVGDESFDPTRKLSTAASTSAQAGFRIRHGAAPTSPLDGDVWTTTAGLYVRIDGVTVGPLGDSPDIDAMLIAMGLAKIANNGTVATLIENSLVAFDSGGAIYYPGDAPDGSNVAMGFIRADIAGGDPGIVYFHGTFVARSRYSFGTGDNLYLFANPSSFPGQVAPFPQPNAEPYQMVGLALENSTSGLDGWEHGLMRFALGEWSP